MYSYTHHSTSFVFFYDFYRSLDFEAINYDITYIEACDKSI